MAVWNVATLLLKLGAVTKDLKVVAL